MDYEIVEANISHLLPIAADMRAADRKEVWFSHRNTPYEALSRSLAASEEAWTAVINGRPALMWGVARRGCVFSIKGIPWLLATDDIKKCQVEFLKQSRMWVERMMENFAVLENYVYEENLLSIRWLKWCGFEISGRETIINDAIFYKFRKDA